jgi:putative membrane protein
MNRKLTLLFAGLTVLLQIIWPLTQGADRVLVTQLSVLSFAISSFSHAVGVVGWRRTSIIAAFTASAAWLVEYFGTSTGLLFGTYEYSGILQPQIGSVPITVLGAWFMMLWPACVAATTTFASKPRHIQALFAGFLMMSWDFFLDTQMVIEGYWIWSPDSSVLIGMPGIPWTNYLSWLVVGTLLSYAILMLVSTTPINRNVLGPEILLLWTWIGGFIAHSFFWNNLGTAAWGSISLGVCCLIFARAVHLNPETIRS